ncbi:UDP-N-acetylglucosamine--N-acetylmuramyl-(pentapeptide) pyrophosphoryl-undecaprenol N-acetylglucosamine transferase [Paraliobacillus sp. PM-2]|uniref:undecaprenyldiphospho-muramoylpentapeptide beta-N-acetylglucosaminyltransferase n=1 Tax=Paraliobacillus sp. PM-2 TaxID=1462524 RepID=UPI00061B9CFC|nr:undecaprenyldiphospho-muramoylpentapeptide beta-N-acetylglucosaminyltransferase [Paraliobacillus sp. PM-2]CQR47091.1 UDP-N-acetylglucosamine--N-acetylmuramyl-(pentapeptide) pyrophosphoryl-undecaprenol N-acetylglucosamine transferase [Paraliobacillus sp. PM-2]
MSEKRIVLTGGGTAGHVMVNLAIIPTFKEEGWQIDYIGSKTGIERELIENIPGVTYHSVSTGKLRRYMSKENFKDPFKVMKGIAQSFRILGEIKPQVVFSKGGFVSVPVLIAARMRGIPAVIHESDITPGLANKLAMPFAKKVLATFPETLHSISDNKAKWIGAVVRSELLQGNKQKGLAYAKLSGDKPVLLIMGGSAGARRINEVVREQLDELVNQFEIIHICGKNNLDETIKHKNYTQFEYVNEELPDLLHATDYVLSRAGANAIFEFLALKKPMLLIPLSRKASRGDQILNASSFQKQGYAHVLEEEQLTGDTLVTALDQLREESATLKKKMQKYKSIEAKEKVIKIIKQTAKK